jgi:hypothetical protein
LERAGTIPGISSAEKEGIFVIFAFLAVKRILPPLKTTNPQCHQCDHAVLGFQ